MEMTQLLPELRRLNHDAVVTDRKAALALIGSGKFAPKRQGKELASDTFAKRKLIEKELEERRYQS